MRDKNYHKLADNARIDVYTGEGSFASPETVAVKTTQGTQQIGGKYIVINTGAETVIPPIEGIAQSRRVYTSTSIMELEELPQHLVIVGGGYIGLEFASMYASFGSKVTVLEGFAELIRAKTATLRPPYGRRWKKGHRIPHRRAGSNR